VIKRPRKERSFEVRPVSARPLKSALDSLRPQLAGCRALDLFCGLGRFGLGALKEEAEMVVFVDTNAKYLADIKKLADPYVGRAQFIREDVFRYLGGTKETFDVVFADPPFPLWSESFDRKLFGAVLTRLNASAIFLVKHPAGMIASGTGFTHWKTSRFGESALSYFTHGEEG